ncbi:MAG: trypsin-like peptidase domain-containing protein [Specibacter sp.]
MSENIGGDTNRNENEPEQSPLEASAANPASEGATNNEVAAEVHGDDTHVVPLSQPHDPNATEPIGPMATPAVASAPGNPAEPIYPQHSTQSWQPPAQPTQPTWNQQYFQPGQAAPSAQDPATSPLQEVPASADSYPQPAGHEPQHSSQPSSAGYPASNAYPHTLAPAVTARPRARKKVGMGLFGGSVVAAALVGALVAGGTTFLVDQQSNSTAASSTQQVAPLVVNNTSSVNAVTAAAAKAMPSVVTISASSGSSGGTGSGIILDTAGHILTNTHVVTLDGAAANATISVQTSNGKVYAGTVVGTDPLSDLAIVKINAPNLVPAVLGDSSTLNVGDNVVAIGAPLGLSGTVTDGIVSTLSRTIQVASSAVPSTPSDSSQGGGSNGGNGFQFSPPDGSSGSSQTATGTVNLNVIQTDAAINPGNSGGALVNSAGQVIGVNVAIASAGSSSSSSSQSGNIGVGFSIPINNAKRIAQELIATGKATHGQLGVSVQDATAGGSSGFTVGAKVAAVTSGSPAAKAGLQVGDVITQMGTQTVSDGSSLTAAVRQQAGGATVKVTYTRNGKTMSADVTLGTAAAS